MPKTILIIRNAYSYDFGGGERFPVELALLLSIHDFTPIVISRSERLLSLAQARGVKTTKGWWWSRQDFSGKRLLLFPLYVLWQLVLICWYLGIITKTRAATVHPQSRDDFIAATFAAKLLGKRVIWTDHADLKYIWQNHKIWYKNPTGKLVYVASKFTDYITLVSNSEKQLIETNLGHTLPAKFHVIHNGVRDAHIQPVQRKSKDKDSVIFVATSRLVKAKGIGELIQAFRQISPKQDVRLWLLGEGPEEVVFRNMAEDDPRIVFFGFPDNALAYVAAADIFVHPSYHEGFSISLVEACMLGKPLIACNVGGNPEIINHKNGILVAPMDVTSLQKAMEKLLQKSGLRNEYGVAARAAFAEEFIFDDIVKEKFIPLYET